MTRFLPRQAWYTLLLLGLYAPVMLTVGSRALAKAWPGLSFIWFLAFLLLVFPLLSWALSRLAFAPDAPSEAETPPGTGTDR